jgi:hypothetical protein
MRKTTGCLVGVVIALTGCAGLRGTPGSKPELALRRGSAWATYTVKPPHITGPSANLVLDDGRLNGFLASGAVDIRIEDDGATGYGPSGPIQLDILREPGETRVDGLWNGAPVHFLFSPEEVRGSVVVRQGKMAVQQSSCAYALGRSEANGALSGSSTCAGMPQQTRLEVHAATAEVLSASELVVLLVAALAAPPISPNEQPL